MRKKFLFIMFSICLFSVSAWASDPAIPGDPYGNPKESDVEKIPLDGGISLLIAAGAAYGAKKYRDYKKN